MTEKALYDRRARRRRHTPRAGGYCVNGEHHRVVLLVLARRIEPKHSARVAPHRALHNTDRLRDLRASRSCDDNGSDVARRNVRLYIGIPSPPHRSYLRLSSSLSFL